jgi:hypothetical protein
MLCKNIREPFCGFMEENSRRADDDAKACLIHHFLHYVCEKQGFVDAVRICLEIKDDHAGLMEENSFIPSFL